MQHNVFLDLDTNFTDDWYKISFSYLTKALNSMSNDNCIIYLDKQLNYPEGLKSILSPACFFY